LNDDLVQPLRGFGEHPHRNMEIVTYVIIPEPSCAISFTRSWLLVSAVRGFHPCWLTAKNTINQQHPRLWGGDDLWWRTAC
jgi:hypothetical protein